MRGEGVFEKLIDLVAERAALIVMRKLVKEGGADVVLAAVRKRAAYEFLKKHGFAVADSGLFMQELDKQMGGSFNHRANVESGAR